MTPQRPLRDGETAAWRAMFCERQEELTRSIDALFEPPRIVFNDGDLTRGATCAYDGDSVKGGKPRNAEEQTT